MPTTPEVPWTIAPWTTEQDTVVLENRIMRLRERVSRSPSDPDKLGRFVVIDTTDWVNVIALTQDEQVVLVEQFRHGTGSVTLEIPGGMVDPGEDMLTAGVRELLEETGYGGGQAALIGVVQPNPAIQSNRCGTVLVRGVSRMAEQRFDEHEEIAVHLLPLAEVHALVRGGQIQHALVLAALLHLELSRPS